LRISSSITKLKLQPGKDIVATGSISLVRSLALRVLNEASDRLGPMRG
jgi:hypothetical protein